MTVRCLLLLIMPGSLLPGERITFTPTAHAPMVEVSVKNGPIEVESHAGPDVVIDYAGTKTNKPPRVDKEENRIAVEFPSSSSGPVKVWVPRMASLRLNAVNGRATTVRDVDGDIEIHEINGNVELSGVGGAVVAHSVNGSVTATLTKIPEGKAMAFSTTNGRVSVRLPGGVRADFRMQTVNGSLRTDFLPPSGSESNRHGRRKILEGKVNGGGPPFSFSSVNGNVEVRRN